MHKSHTCTHNPHIPTTLFHLFIPYLNIMHAHTHTHTHAHTHTHTYTHSHTLLPLPSPSSSCTQPLYMLTHRISWKRNEVADAEATTFSIFYNNTFYLFLVFLLYYFLRSFHPAMYPTTITHDPSLYKPIPPIFRMFSWGSGLVPLYPKVR